MDKKVSFFSLGSVRFQVWKQIILAVLLVVAVVYLYNGYRKTRISAIESYSSQHVIYSNQIINEINFKFELIRNVLELWSNSKNILHMSEKTMPCMERILAAHSNYISGVTRIDEHGIIRYTVPFYEGTVGADISGQEHVQQLLEIHKPVLSDAFMTVQGYWAIAYHVPCFNTDGSFRGSIAFLVPFREMFRILFMQLLPEDETIPLVIDDNGLVLFSLDAEQEGKHYQEVFSDDTGLLKVADAALEGNAGYMLTDFTTFVDDDNQTESMLSTIVPFSFQGTSWALILSIPEKSVMQNISGMSNRWLGGMFAIILLALVYSTLKVRIWIISKEEEKWEDVAHLKDVLIRTVNQAREIIVILDNREKILYANRAAVKISGFGKKFLNNKISKLPFREDHPSMSEIRKKVFRNGTWNGIYSAKGAMDRLLKLDMTVSRIIGVDKAVLNFIIIARDVTDQVEMERKLHEHHKMEAIGQLAGGIAHDFNNLLVGVLGYAELMKERYPSGSDVSRAADVIIAAVQQGSELTKQLLAYARRGKHEIVRVDVGQKVKEVNKLLLRTLDQRINIVLDLDEGIFVKGDPAQIEQVILNLAVNARDAMPEGGELKFTVKRKAVPSEMAGGNSADGLIDFAVLKTIDTGSGISKEHLERIFEPFFTTKNEEGTGMGLATVYGIVVNHGGWVDVDSRPGKGTVFTVYLPFDEDEERQEMEVPGSKDEISSVMGKSIMIVDDDFLVLITLTELLTEIGYKVKSISSGKKAVEEYSGNPGAFDAVILDFSMPEMDGRECFIRLREINPEVKVIIATGFSRDGRVQDLLDIGVEGFLQKPFRLKELASMMEDLLDS